LRKEYLKPYIKIENLPIASSLSFKSNLVQANLMRLMLQSL